MTHLGRKAALCIFLLLTTIGLVRIVLTYRQVAQTVDETPNIACGMEWLDHGTYNLGPFHPPLARIAVAAGPYLAGLRSQGNPDRWKEGNAILHSRGRYARNLTLARLGTLPFFILATACVWLWGRRLMGETGALAAVFLFTNTPMVLAHSGLATTDMAVTAGVVFALYRFARFLQQPDPRRSVWLGIAFALAILAKFSSVPLVPLCGLSILAAYRIAERRLPPAHLRMWALAAAVALFVVWAGYRFSVGRMQELPDSPSVFWRAVGGIPLPAPRFLDGLMQVRTLNRDGHAAFLLGQVSNTGWWYFFPVALAVKTPLAVLLLCASTAGAGVAPQPAPTPDALAAYAREALAREPSAGV
ncbi:MAG: glycosyltransferase family 39 protein, partial [Acidobacteria bacterium]|nr:glycosyltransferase family 39 protein [Acidobacteriota bacterium]